jgi:hypothetical protein
MDSSSSPERNVAIFLDLENMFGGHQNGVTGVPLGRVVREIERIVRNGGMGRRTATIRAYADWGHLGMSSYKAEVLEYGIKPIQIFSFDKKVKNAADIELCVDVLQVVHESPWIDVFVIVTGDGGFVPLIRRLHGLNKYVVIASTNAATAGIVNPLLKSVADEYHQIDVGPASKVTEAKVTTAVVAPKPGPTQKELRAEILSLIKNDPKLLIAGKVNKPVLGNLLRQRWPTLKYSQCGAATLTSFLEKYCADVIIQPAKATTAATVEPQKIVQVSTREEYIAAVRFLFLSGHLGRTVTENGSAGLSLQEVGQDVKNAIDGFSKEEPNFPRLRVALHEALLDSVYQLVVQAGETQYLVINTKHMKPGMGPVPMMEES